MADYREISQQYAQGGINAAILINGGAAVALLSQYADLSSKGLGLPVAEAMISWAVGVLLAAFVWMFGFYSTRYVDKAYDENKPEHIVTSNRWMTFGAVALFFSLIAFVVGTGILACAVLSNTPVLPG